MKGDERILGDSDFVETVLALAKEALDEKYLLKDQGTDFDQVVSRIAKLMRDNVTVHCLWDVTPNRQGPLLCFGRTEKLE